MCDLCDDWDAREPPAAGPHPRIARRARVIERAMPGTAVADAVWRIALGEESGAISWADHLRIVAALEAAAAEPAPVRRLARRSGRRALACDAAG